ncbi:MAG: Sua5/YciO/YrdC/YwlC family protein, partial [Bdellovibrionaceae bacterium]|nr:Sua5/YciO/YrdC/YwlC family protein [Pseudobdellovibrionaceae bacterium]
MKTHDLKLAIDSLNSGQVVAIPTETVYGLAGRIDNPIAIKSIFTVKERPFFDPLIVHVFSIDQARTLTTNWSNAAQALALALWP